MYASTPNFRSQTSELVSLDMKLADAVSKRDFKLAAQLQCEIEEMTKILNQKRDLEQAIKAAVIERNWANADLLQKQIDALDQGVSFRVYNLHL